MRSRFWILVAVLACAASAAPIRVGILSGTAPNRYWHTSLYPASVAVAAMLANPSAANLGSPPVPPQGFAVTTYGPVDSSQCFGQGCGPTAQQKADFIAALDSLDVAVVLNFVDFGAAFTSQAHRERLMSFWITKGLVSLHQSNDQFGTWAPWTDLNAARFQNHPTSERAATLRLESAGPERAQLNAGLPDTLRLSEEWFSFTTSGAIIRGYSHLQVHMVIDEDSYEGGMGGARAMGDHPMAWSREFPEGGRFFYTALAHKTSTIDSVYFFRRQLYNAILWAGGYDVATAIADAPPARRFSDAVRVAITGSSLAVSVLRDGPHAVEVRSLDGGLVASRHGAGRTEHRFDRLPSGSTLVVTVKSDAGRVSKLVAAP